MASCASDAVIPSLISGLFTKAPLAQEAIDKYLVRNKEETGLRTIKEVRKELAAKENPVVDAFSTVTVPSNAAIPTQGQIDKERVRTDDKNIAAAAAVVKGPSQEEIIQMAVDAENAALPKSKSQQKRIKAQKGK